MLIIREYFYFLAFFKLVYIVIWKHCMCLMHGSGAVVYSISSLELIKTKW